MTPMTRIAMIAALAAIPVLGTATPDRAWALSQAQSLRLNPEASGHYREALARFDKIEDREGVRALAAAADAQPDHVSLQLMTARAARRLAEVSTGAESEEAYRMAGVALERLESMNDLVSADAEALAKERALITEASTTVADRDAKRLETGLKLVTKIRKERLERMGREDVGAANIAAEEEAAEEAKPENSFEARRAKAWPQFGAPGVYIPRPSPVLAGGFGGEGGFAPGTTNPFGPGGGFATGDPFGGGAATGAVGGDPFAQGATGFGAAPTDPFGGGGTAFGADPFAAAPTGLADPFASGGAAFGAPADPFGAGPGAAVDPFGGAGSNQK